MVGCEVEGWSWAALGSYVAGLGATVGGLGWLWGPMWAVLGSSHGASVGDLGRLLGPMWAVLGRSLSLCGRSWVALGAEKYHTTPLHAT